jgi:elongation factor G
VDKINLPLSFAVHAGAGEATVLLQELEALVRNSSGMRVEDGVSENHYFVSGNDETKLEDIREGILRTHSAEIGEMRINLLETIGRPSESEGKYIRQTRGHGNYGHCRLRIGPGERGSGYAFKNDVNESLVPGMYIESIERGIREAMKSGILAGFPMVDLRVTLFDGSYHEADSNPTAFQFAAAIAFKEAAMKAAPFVLEPMMEAEVITPEESIGTVIGDINVRRGRILSVETTGAVRKISVILPLAEALRSSPRGRPDYPLRFAGYEAAPRRDGFHGDDAAAYAGKPKNPWSGRGSSTAKPETGF